LRSDVTVGRIFAAKGTPPPTTQIGLRGTPPPPVPKALTYRCSPLSDRRISYFLLSSLSTFPRALTGFIPISPLLSTVLVDGLFFEPRLEAFFSSFSHARMTFFRSAFFAPPFFFFCGTRAFSYLLFLLFLCGSFLAPIRHRFAHAPPGFGTSFRI